MQVGKQWKVYVHINKVNHKRYVGITSHVDANQRWLNGRGYMYNKHFNNAIKKYGWDGFEHIILYEGLSEQQAKGKEKELIAEWGTYNRDYGYNLTMGGDGSVGFHPTEETRAKLSRARRKENLSKETLARRSAGLRGRKFSDEHKRKIGIGNSKAIHMLDCNGTILQKFSSAREVEEQLKISHSHISQCCHGHRMTAGGYRWQFAEEL